MAFGLLAGGALSAALWYARFGHLRPASAALGLLGAGIGLAIARAKRWRDEDVALFLDARLGSQEAIATALELARSPSEATSRGDLRARDVVLAHAERALADATPKSVRAPLLRKTHGLALVGAAAIATLTLLPLPPAPARAEPPKGSDRVQMADVAGLDKIIELAELDARDEAQKERLKKLADEAKRIREKIRAGAERREVQSDIAKLRDQITAERLSLGDGEERKGLESALGKMGENADMKDAAKALGDRDLIAFDQEMEKLANKLEKQDRDRAKKTLEEAADAAKKAGAGDVAKHLEEQKKRLDEKGKDADKLKELGKAIGDGLGEEGKRALEEMQQKGGEKEKRELAKRLEEALGKMTPEERKQLAENLKKQAQEGAKSGADPSPMSKEELRKMAEELATPEGQRALEESLKQMAEAPEKGSAEGERQKGLGDAEKGAGDAQRQLGAPVPVDGAEKGGGDKSSKGRDGQGQKAGGNADGRQGDGKDKGGGSSPGTGPGGSGTSKPAGQTPTIGGDGVRSRADAKVNKGKTMPGVTMGRTSSKPGETANVQGTGALGAAAADEVGAIERSDVPEEYREQVGRYFQAQ